MCRYEVTRYPFCGVPCYDVTTDQARDYKNPKEPVCCRFKFHPCSEATQYGGYCHGISPCAGLKKLVSIPNTTINVSLDDCNLPDDLPRGCVVGTPQVRRDVFGTPVRRLDGTLDEVVRRRPAPGHEVSVFRYVFTIERNVGT